MTVIVMVDVQGQTQAGYDGMLKVLADVQRQADGFVLHSAYRVDGNWRVLEVWRSKDDADRFFAKHVAPNLPPGVRPKRTIHEAHSLVTPDAVGGDPLTLHGRGGPIAAALPPGGAGRVP